MSEFRHSETRRSIITIASVMLLLGGWSFIPGCGNKGADTSDGSGTNFKGIATGVVSDSRSTRESLDSPDGSSTGQLLPPDIDAGVVSVTVETLEGGPLLDANGQPYPPGSVDGTGKFLIENLPVGIDIVIAVDLDGDGQVDIRHIIQIPADETGEAGRIDNVVVDPLTTLIVARLRELFAEHGVDPEELGISPTAVVQRVVDAFIHLFEESGIDQDVSIEDIEQLTDGNIEELLEAVLPAIVRAGLETVDGNLALGRASELEGVVHAAAEVFLRAGFPIADDPGGFDFSFLGDLPDVEVTSFDMLFGPRKPLDEPAAAQDLVLDQALIDQLLADGSLDAFLADGTTIEELIADGTILQLIADGTIDLGILDEIDGIEGIDGLDGIDGIDGISPDPDLAFDPHLDGEMPVIYISTVSEPDRNFVVNDEFDPDEGGPPLPFLNDRLLGQIARLHLQDRTITVRNLYRILTDEAVGLGVRLTYVVPGPMPDGPPPMVFESADGNGVARNVDELFRMLEGDFDDGTATLEELAAKDERIRQVMREMLAGTVPPSMERLFGAILSERIESVNQLFDFIRKAMVHLPFNRSGPSMFFVVADGDRFRPDAGEVNAVSVDVQFGPEGLPAHVTYNASHIGTYYLAYTHETESNNRVELLVRETGRWLHGPHGGPVFLDMGNPTMFDPINGVPFADYVSEEGTFWPGIAVPVSNPEHQMGDDGGNELSGPTMQLYVLATMPGPDGEPVRVDYDVNTGTFSASPAGRYYMMFIEETYEQGLFGLYDIDLNFMASTQDLSGDRFVDSTAVWEEPPPPTDEPLLPPDEPLTTDEPLLPPDEPLTTDGAGTADEPPAGQEVPLTGEEPPLPTTEELPPPDDGLPPPPEPEPIYFFEPVMVTPAEVDGLGIRAEFFRFVYGTEVPNERFDASNNPYFDDVNGDGVQSPGESTADFRPTLFNPDDWRSTDISRYYRRAGGGTVTNQDIDWESSEPRANDGEALVARNFVPRLNAFKFGRPNSAINLLTSFLPPEFFDGTHAFTADTPLGIFQALSTINLVMEQMFNVEAVIDIDGAGPFPAERMMIDAHLFVPPIGDPFVLLLNGFETLSEPRAEE